MSLRPVYEIVVTTMPASDRGQEGRTCWDSRAIDMFALCDFSLLGLLVLQLDFAASSVLRLWQSPSPHLPVWACSTSSRPDWSDTFDEFLKFQQQCILRYIMHMFMVTWHWFSIKGSDIVLFHEWLSELRTITSNSFVEWKRKLIPRSHATCSRTCLGFG